GPDRSAEPLPQLHGRCARPRDACQRERRSYGAACTQERNARPVARLPRGRSYDLVYATSSRLLTAALGGLVARRTNAVLYLDIRDIFVDTINDVLPAPLARLAGPVFTG